ncbi:MAG: chemoreceptor glutamine deamidase CheD [Gallionellaceae bacterium]|nr:chemoreceptor glutamine deamidase CheD [Gallionellaceae bacterium]
MTDHSDYQEVLSPNRYYDDTFDKEAIKLLPGEYYVTNRDMVLVTVLGSCVAACIRDRKSGVGGMNHFMLPENKAEAASPVATAARYGAYAMEMMINQLLKNGAKRENLEAKLFGGGNVLRGFTVTNVGQRNVEFAMDYLKNEKIRVVAQSILDIYPRKIYFFPATGKVMLRKLKHANNDTIIEREAEYGSRLKHADIEGDIDLF